MVLIVAVYVAVVNYKSFNMRGYFKWWILSRLCLHERVISGDMVGCGFTYKFIREVIMVRMLNRAFCVGLVCVLASCAGVKDAETSYSHDGQIVREDLNGAKAVEVYNIEPKDMSYVNFAPDIDHEIVQNDDVIVYEVPPRKGHMTRTQRTETQKKERWHTLLSMWRGGLNIGSSLYDDDSNYNE